MFPFDFLGERRFAVRPFGRVDSLISLGRLSESRGELPNVFARASMSSRGVYFVLFLGLFTDKMLISVFQFPSRTPCNFVSRQDVIYAVDALRRPSGVPDVPSKEYIDEDFSKVAGLVNNVSREWCCHVPEKDTLLLYMPGDPNPSSLSRDHFVELLELCEDVLHYKRVLVCFDKANIHPRHGIARALNCVGFNVLPPDSFPAFLNKNTLFSMVYEL